MPYNFSAGPAILPKEVIQEAAQAVLDFNNSGLSLIEISHRSKDFVAVMDEARLLAKELLGAGEDFEALFLGGGASLQFAMAPMNLLNDDEKAGYIDTGAWSSKAIKDAKLYGHIDVIASSKDQNYSYIPKEYAISSDYKFLHVTSNNTIYGTQYKNFPETSVPLVADMSSDIFSRTFDINKFDLIYAGAQKNMGPAGATLVLVKKSALGKVQRNLANMLNYTNHINGESMYNTPPVFPVYVSMLTMRWVKNQGGVQAIQKINENKAGLLWSEIDRNPLFHSPTHIDDRSNMNVCFLLKDINLEAEFLANCKAAGCSGLGGHRSVGGFRASIYNAMPLEGVEVLIGLMQEFERTKG